MDFSIHKKKRANADRFEKSDLDIAYAFSKAVHDEYGELVKAMVLFGSVSTRTQKEGSDLDVLIILDDLMIQWTKELAETYKIITEKKIAEISSRIHVTTVKLTSFWDYVRNGDPVGINILRTGTALIDTGIFGPMQALLHRGRIRPSPESIWNYHTRAQNAMRNSRGHLLGATVDLYWACIDAAHAALMKAGEMPPSPDHVADLIERTLVPKGYVDKSHVKTMRFFYKLYKSIIHRTVDEIAGPQYEKYYASADGFVSAMRSFIERDL
ncbi:MAG: nucleotidyltransferase domain-containing protein [Nanoarchaeota archaeon]